MLPADAGGAQHPVDPQLRVQVQQILLQRQQLMSLKPADWSKYVLLHIRPADWSDYILLKRFFQCFFWKK